MGRAWSADEEPPRRLLDELVVVNGGVGSAGPALLEMSHRETAVASYLHSRDPDNECEHGSLPVDGPAACGCFHDTGVKPIRHEEIVPQPAPAPPAPAITTEEARELVTSVAKTDPDAPWGRKANGEPKKRPGRKPATAAAKLAAPAKKRRRRKPAPALTTAEARTLVSPPEITKSIDERLAALREEEQRLVKARAALAG